MISSCKALSYYLFQDPSRRKQMDENIELIIQLKKWSKLGQNRKKRLQITNLEAKKGVLALKMAPNRDFRDSISLSKNDILEMPEMWIVMWTGQD